MARRKHEFLGIDVKDESAAREWLTREWQASQEEVDRFDILVAADWQESYEGSAWILLRERSTGKLFEVSGGHCSCMGYEGQFEPAPSSETYLLSDNFNVSYRTEPKITDYIKRNFGGKKLARKTAKSPTAG
jgi:hypothetical protein